MNKKFIAIFFQFISYKNAVILIQKNLPFHNHLCRFALRRRYSACILAEPEPWLPVMYAFFLALVFTPVFCEDDCDEDGLNTMPSVNTFSILIFFHPLNIQHDARQYTTRLDAQSSGREEIVALQIGAYP